MDASLQNRSILKSRFFLITAAKEALVIILCASGIAPELYFAPRGSCSATDETGPSIVAINWVVLAKPPDCVRPDLNLLYTELLFDEELI